MAIAVIGIEGKVTSDHEALYFGSTRYVFSCINSTAGLHLLFCSAMRLLWQNCNTAPAAMNTDVSRRRAVHR